jgi:hypothetical protein
MIREGSKMLKLEYKVKILFKNVKIDEKNCEISKKLKIS